VVNSEFSKSKFILSHLNIYDNKTEQSPLSIKIVSEGLERYSVNNRNYKLEANSYLIVNKSDALEVNVKTDSITKGVCIYPPQDLIDEVFNFRLKSEKELLEFENHNDKKITFTQKKNAMMETSTGVFLKQHLPQITASSSQFTSKDFNNLYIQLAEHLVNDQLQIDAQLMNFSSSKKQTKEELYRRISLAKDYIHENYKEKIIIEDLATVSCLSKYHFLRSFRDFYKCTPYQYILHLKLKDAQQLFANGFSYSHISEAIGFSDPKNLRKALKNFCLF